MSGLKQKREQLVKQIRQNNRESMKAGLRSIALNRLCGNQTPLISSVLCKFSDLYHYQLTKHADQIMDVLNSTPFQQLQDDQHEEIVTDLFYLLHQKIIGYPYFLKFKKNQAPYTASLVAYLSEDLQGQEIAYWFNYMCQQDKKLVLQMVDGDQCQRKWITDNKLFIYLMQSLKWFSEAAIAFKLMLLNCDQLKKKHIDQSLKYIVQAINYSRKEQNEEVRFALVGLLINILQAYYRIKSNNQKMLELSTLLRNQLTYNIEIFTFIDTLADINKLYDVEQLSNYLENQETGELILNYISHRLLNNQLSFKSDELEYYLNNFFQLYYNQWRSLQLRFKDYRYGSRVKEGIKKLDDLAGNNIWYKKLKNILL